MQILSRLGGYNHFLNNVAAWGKDFRQNFGSYSKFGPEFGLLWDLIRKRQASHKAEPSSVFSDYFLLVLNDYWKGKFHSENASNVFRQYYVGEIWKNVTIIGHFGFIGKLGQRNHITIVTSSFSKNSVFVKTLGNLRNHDGNGNGNVTEQKNYWAVQWLCRCVIILGTFLCRPL